MPFAAIACRIKFIEVDELDQRMTVYVTQEMRQSDRLSGSNVRLASILTGWHLKILSEDQCKQIKSARLD